jgi:hypothetical protein
MIAAIYARKSTEQNGVADDQKSVTRQIQHARQYASARAGPCRTITRMWTMESQGPSSQLGRGFCG